MLFRVILWWTAAVVSCQNSQILASVKTNGSYCPSDELRMARRNRLQSEAESLLLRELPLLNCPCGGAGEWRRIAHLNMSDPNQQCPSDWSLITAPVRACGGGENYSCVSAEFSSPMNLSYSRVCGRLHAYKMGAPDAFWSILNSNCTDLECQYISNCTDLECPYMDGVSLTHGAAGLRQHIWSFAAGLNENDTYYFCEDCVCPCSNLDTTWQDQITTFIGNNYFCDTGNPGPGNINPTVYVDDPLWDGAGCAPDSTCCQFNTPPWFCATLPQPTTESIEVRICKDGRDEDILVSYFDIHVK